MKWAIYIGAGIGGFVGGYIPVMFWGMDVLDPTTLFTGFGGTLLGLWIGYKIGKAFEL
jgi:hypothetical protein